jgi:hypothetical protein
MVGWAYHIGNFTDHFSLQIETGDFAGVHAEGEVGLLSWPTTRSFSNNYFIAS